MLPTPELNHLTSADFEHVYEPAEDTFLLLDALEQDQDLLCSQQPRICLEIGSGSGCASAFLASILGKRNAVFLCTDINPYAASATRRTGERNQVPLEPICTDLTGGLRLAGCVDVLLFNPPYVPTLSSEIAQTGIAASWAGGVAGREVTDRLLPQIPALLSPGGRFYLVTVRENKPQEMIDELERAGLDGKVVAERRAGPERLAIIRFTKPLVGQC